MTQTQQDPSQKPSTSPPGEDDPLAHLHKMSTTAGLGSGDYVAVNAAAVVALILGFASALILIEEYLIVLPIARAIVSIVAWVQIRNSNGTQTGRSLVVGGLLAAIAFGGLVGLRKYYDWQRTRDDRAAIAALIQQLGDDVKAGRFDAAYARFTDRFHDRVKPPEFEARMKFVQHSELYGGLKRFSWNGLIQFERDEATGTLYAAAPIQFEVEKANPERPLMDTVGFRKANDKWEIENFPLLFPPPQAPQR